jgi:hypothetical protein
MSTEASRHVEISIRTGKPIHHAVLGDKSPSVTTVPHTYSILDSESKEIRVLEVAPGVGDDIVTGTLKNVSLLDDPAPVYETISYCWGQNKDPVNIQLDGCSTTVTASSEAAVKRMRLSDQPRVLWIDAICINQSSLSERSEQVALMSDVYRTAKQNLVYLGDDDDEMAERAMKSVELLHAEMCAATDNLETLRETLYDDATGAGLYSDDGFTIDIDIEALNSLFSRPWFR